MQHFSIKKIALCFMMGQSLFMYASSHDVEEGNEQQQETDPMVQVLPASQINVEQRVPCVSNCKHRLKWMAFVSICVGCTCFMVVTDPCIRKTGEALKNCTDFEINHDDVTIVDSVYNQSNQTIINNITKPVFAGNATRLLESNKYPKLETKYPSKNQMRKRNR